MFNLFGVYLAGKDLLGYRAGVLRSIQPKNNLEIKGGVKVAAMTGAATKAVDAETPISVTLGGFAEIEAVPGLIFPVGK